MVGKPPYRITAHAQRRMASRGITLAQIEYVLEAPERAVPDPNQHSYRLERELRLGLLKVWVVEPWPPAGTVVVKSAAWKD
jgi:hypothetical protein